MITLPVGFPSKVMSKNTLVLAIAAALLSELQYRRGEDNSEVNLGLEDFSRRQHIQIRP